MDWPTEPTAESVTSPSTPHNPDVDQGGLGGLPIVNPRTSGQDLRLLRAATKWNVRPELRAKVLSKMEEILDDGGAEHRDKIGAGKVVLAADAVDAKREATEMEAGKPTSGSVTFNVLGQVQLQGMTDAQIDAMAQIQKVLRNDGSTVVSRGGDDLPGTGETGSEPPTAGAGI